MAKKKGKKNIYFNSFDIGGGIDPNVLATIRARVQEAREATGLPNVFLDEWNKLRLATGRFDDLLGEGRMELLKANRDSTPVYTTPTSYGINSYLRTMPLVKSKNMTDEEAEVRRYEDAKLFARLFRARSLNTTEGGVEGITLGLYNPKANTVYANPEGGESTLLHELSHASQATSLENKISEILGTSNSSGTHYYDRPTEVYSRLMEFRKANNLSPSEIIDKKRLKELKESGTDFNLLFRYKDNLLLDLFNNVAQVNTPTNDLFNYAAYGGRINRFDLGGSVKIPTTLTNPLGNSPITNTLSGGLKFTTKLGLGSNFMGNLGSSITSFLGSGLGINMVSNAAFGLLNPNGNSTGIGNAMQTIGGLASNIPGVGGMVGAAVGAVGGLVNAAFGSKINEENVALFRNLNKQLMNYTSNASTNEELLADFAGMSHLANVKKSDVGSDGWFSNKAKNLTRDINAERLRANLAAITSLGNTTLTVDTTNDLLKGYNYAAYGGPINMRYAGTMSPFGNLFKDGGIYIKPSKRGTFTAAAKKHGKSVLAFASQVLANKENYSPAMVKKANFARNAAKWHDEGGPLDGLTPQERLNIALGRTPSGRPLELGLIDVYPEMMLIPTGGMPGVSSNLGLSFGKKAVVKGLRGIESVLRNTDKIKKKVDDTVYDVIDELEGMATDGIPNLSETFKKVSNGTKKVYKKYSKSNLWPALFLDENNNSLTDSSLYKEPLGEALEEYAFGGELTHGGVFSNGTSIIGNGGTHEENPYDGIQVGVDELGIPNLVELDEVIWNDYVFSNRLKVPKAVKLKYKLRGNKELSFADAAKNILKESEERPNDPISLNGLDAALSRLAMEQELIRMKKELRLNKYAEGGELGNLYKGTGSKSNFLLFKKKSYPNPFSAIPDFSEYTIKDPFKTPEPSYTTPDFNISLLKPNASSLEGYVSDVFEPISKDIFKTKVKGTKESSNDTRRFREDPLRYAPTVGHAAGVISDIFSKPDYLAADELRGIELNPSLVGFTPIANKLRYKPMDILRFLNPLNALASALRRNVMNISGGNRAIAMAGLLNVDLNLGNQVGQALISADEYNLASEERRETFNRATDLYNSEMGLKAAMANAEARNAMSKARYERDKAAALLSQLARDTYNTRRSNNLNILLEDLGNLGRERDSRNVIEGLIKRGILKDYKSANGGKLNRKKKGGFTYA